MPEGDTVWNTARTLDRALAGQRLTRSDFRVPQLATVDLAGATVTGCASRGKHLLLRLTVPDRPGGARIAGSAAGGSGAPGTAGRTNPSGLAPTLAPTTPRAWPPPPA